MCKHWKGTGSLLASMGVCDIGVAVGSSVEQILLYDWKQMEPALGNTSLPNGSDAPMH